MRITIPTNLNEITLEKLQTLQTDIGTIENEAMLKFKTVSNLCNVPLKELIKIKPSDVMDIFTQLQPMLKEKPELVKRFVIDGVEYGFIPDLEKISTAEYLDLEAYFGKDVYRTMAILYRPVTKSSNDLYLIEPYEGTDKYCELMKKSPASAYESASVFFYALGRELLIHTTESLVRNLTQEEQMLLSKNGVGISQLMQFPEMIEQNIARL